MQNNNPPLIAHVIYALGTGGLENGLVNIINRIPPGRYRHAIVCLTTADDFASRITVPGVEIITLNKKPGQDPGVYWRLWRTLRALQPAILHTRNLAAIEMQAIGLLLPGLKKVHGEHGRDIYDLDGSNRKYQLLRRALAPFIGRFITVSEDLRHWLVDVVGIAAAKVTQIYNGVDQARFVQRDEPRPALAPEGFLPQDAILIGTVGRLAEVKDQQSLLHAMRILVDRMPEWRKRLRLVLVGDGPLFDPLQKLVDELKLSEFVWMPGDRKDVPELFRMMDVFVLPSLAEGVSNTILEAMASGLPIVATRTGGNPELIRQGENGYLVPVADPETLASTLEELLNDPEKMRAMGQAGRRIVNDTFNWDRTVERYLSIYDELLSAH